VEVLEAQAAEHLRAPGEAGSVVCFGAHDVVGVGRDVVGQEGIWPHAGGETTLVRRVAHFVIPLWTSRRRLPVLRSAACGGCLICIGSC
jgi:hypothetical protein